MEQQENKAPVTTDLISVSLLKHELDLAHDKERLDPDFILKMSKSLKKHSNT